MQLRSFVSSLALALFLVGCSGNEAGGPGGGPSASDARPDVDVSSQGELVARVGKGGVTVTDYVDRAIRSPASVDGVLTPEAQKEIINTLVTEEALWQEAVAHGLYRDPKVRKIMVNLLLREEIYANVSASDFSPEQLKAYFDEHQDEFVVPEKVQVKRIFLRIGPERDKQAALNLAADIRNQLVAQPERFKELAVQHSDGPYKRRGGDLGYLSSEGKPGIDDDVVAEAFKLDVGQISQPFEAAGGVNLISVTSKRERVERTFEQMKGSVLRKLKNEKYKELTDAYVDRVKDKFDVTIDEKTLSSIDLAEARKARMNSGADLSEPILEDGGDDHGDEH